MSRRSSRAMASPVLIRAFRGGELHMLGEIIETRGGRTLCDPHSTRKKTFVAEPWRFRPEERRMLGRGIHVAPWREPDESRYGVLHPVLSAVDSAHHLVAAMTVRPHTTATAVRRALEVVLEAHEAGEVETAESASACD